MRLNREVGAYRQRDLEAAGHQKLEAIRDMAANEFNLCLESHAAAGGCRRCEYFEHLAGAADQVLIQRRFRAAEIDGC